MIALPADLQNNLKACRTLPSVPAVVLEVLDLCQSEDVSVGQVGKVLARDPALTAKVLKVANSPWYGVRSQITTLERAITILGINAALSLALSFSLVRNLQKSKTSSFDHQAFWKRCVITAAASQEVGRWARAANQDELFLGGLLQNLGVLVLNEAMPESYGRLIAAAGQDHILLATLERQAFGSDHAEVGAWQLERWNFPLKLQLALACSHSGQCKNPEISAFCKSVALAGFIADIWIQPDPAAATAAAREKSISLFDMSSEQFQNILDNVARVLPEVTSNLDINIGGEDFVAGILDQARACLVELSLQASRVAREIQLQAQKDNLTSLANRSYISDVLPHQFLAARESGQPLSVLFLDVDHFKHVNDSYGHPCGDRVLVAIGQILHRYTRGSDVVARYGGDEFLVILSNAGEKAAFDICKRILNAVQAGPYKADDGSEIRVSISIGCATMSADRSFSSVDDLIRTADRCLYAAQRGGRNRIVTLNQLALASAGTPEAQAV